MQQVMIAGRITKDAELRRTQKGDDIASFSVAVSNGKDAQGNWRDSTFWDCSLFGKRASALINALSKGTNVTVTGRPSAREYNGKVYLQCAVDQVALQGGPKRNDNQQGGGYNEGGMPSSNDYNDLDDAVPFAPEWRI